jgi:hypothetical protein
MFFGEGLDRWNQIEWLKEIRFPAHSDLDRPESRTRPYTVLSETSVIDGRLATLIPRRSFQRFSDLPHHMRKIIALALLLIGMPVKAWDVTFSNDQITGRVLTWATASSPPGKIVFGCLNGYPQPLLVFSRRVTLVNQTLTYRIDDGPVVSRQVLPSKNGRTLAPWMDEYRDIIWKFENAKRLRVWLEHDAMDFNLDNGRKLPEFDCH